MEPSSYFPPPGNTPQPGINPPSGRIPPSRPQQQPVEPPSTPFQPLSHHEELQIALHQGNQIKIGRYIALQNPLDHETFLHIISLFPNLTQTAIRKYPELVKDIFLHISGDDLVRLGEITIQLIRNGAAIDLKRSDGTTPFEKFCELGMKNVVDEILTTQMAGKRAPSGSDASEEIAAAKRQKTAPSENGNEPVQLPVSPAALEEFYQHGLETAIRCGQKEILSLFLSYGPFANLKTASGMSLLSLAAYSGQVEIMQLLVGHGAVPNERDAHGMTALEYAKTNNQVNAITYLVALSPIPESDDQYQQEYLALFEKYGDKIQYKQGSFWTFFNSRGAGIARDFKGYDKARNQWKVFLNPKKEQLLPVLDRVMNACLERGLPFSAKIVGSSTSTRKANVLEDPCEPKIVFYFTGEDSDDAKEKLHAFVELVDEIFTEEEINNLGCEEGTREVWVKNEPAKGAPRYIKAERPQSGPSFTKQHNKLIYYSQGGYTESGRRELVVTQFNESEMRRLFAGENYYRYRGDQDPFDNGPSKETMYAAARERVERWTHERTEELQRLWTDPNIADPTTADTKTIERYIKKQHAYYYTSTTRQRKIAQIKLGKDTVTDEEVAHTTGQSLTAFRVRRIQEAHQHIGGDFDLQAIAERLGESPETVKEWLAQSEEELVIRDSLGRYGTLFSGDVHSVSQEEVVEGLQDLEWVLTRMDDRIEDFNKPYDVMKLYTIRTNLNALQQAHPHLRLTHLQNLTSSLLDSVISGMNRARKSALIGLAEAQSTPKPLRELLYSNIYGVASPSMPTSTVGRLAKSSTDEQVHALLNQAKEHKHSIDTLLRYGENVAYAYSLAKSSLPASITSFCDNQQVPGTIEEKLRLVSEKLQNVITRQENRLSMLQQGMSVHLPLFFHATKDTTCAFSILSSGIRPAPATYYGAFVSTYPGMLRYGGIIVGLPERAAFESEIAQHKFPASSEPLFLPDKYVKTRQVMREQLREKWIGFANVVGIHPRAEEMKQRFLEQFSLKIYQEFMMEDLQEDSLKTADDLANFDETTLEHESYFMEEFEKCHLHFTFDPDANTPSQGVWKAKMEYSQEDRRYVDVFESKKVVEEDRQELAQSISVIPGARGAVLHPSLISLDQDPLLRAHFTSWTTHQLDMTDIPTLQAQYRDTVGFTEMTTSQQNEVNAYLNTQFVPLMEQLIEFDIMTKAGVTILPEWLQ